jgi:flagellar basal body-associated protein FliL
MTNSQKIIIALVVLVCLGFGIYYVYFGSDGTLSVDFQDQTSSQQSGDDIVNLVAELKKVSIDPALFSNPLFTNLKDISVPIYEETKGRANPFDPV